MHEKRMKKMLAVLLGTVMAIGMLTGCNTKAPVPAQSETSDIGTGDGTAETSSAESSAKG
ncbi:hypothetical protein Ana3638_13490 [Anaerocolumna sedimenticola]|uniref:Uncharacterized protein n=1 Tax=Anaerocolumna sedimenticola TaxID=2696063 RepID=A0A6P1TKD0_9FIRM|nr:hypothetical protein [Anaerocolumna sedimenticola]QHQ61660.1 hypothetical protein Ana3638_13490 [Anaerocolumna sedimenticola]